ncbi:MULTISPECIES: hypothetical protein [Gaetbulibacter]|uniref:hypothetical protein n=1 Tax=Gaetbulibacter TaxID=311207 RepID=UPI0021D1895E|nr:hypothetical protein [Gaetbulibacter sp. NE]
MKLFLQLYFALFTSLLFSQDTIKTRGLFYKVSAAVTLTTNDDYSIGNDDGETFINPNAIFINNTLGYQFDERSSIGLNIEYDRYFKQELNFFPVHLSFRYNVFDFDDKVFVRGGYGKMIDLGKNFESGTLYKLGIGYQAFDDNFKNSWLIGLDFNRKRFGFRQTEKLSSVSFFLEFMLF